MINKDELIRTLERQFREKRIYGDSEDFKLFKQKRNETGPNCKILINEYYSHGGFPYPDNKSAENDPANYVELSKESVEDGIKSFISYKIKGIPMIEMPLYRIDLNKPPVLSNLVPMSLSSYFVSINSRKEDIFQRNPNSSFSNQLRLLAEKRNDLVLEMRDNPDLSHPKSEIRKDFDKIYSEMALIENNIIRTHIEKYIGEIEHTLYIDDDKSLPFYLFQIPKLKNKDFGVLITSGFSMLPLTVPDRLSSIFNYLEFVMAIPSDFPLPLDNSKNHEYYWLIEKLLFFIHYLHRKHTYFCDGHTYGNGNPPKPFTYNSKLCGFLIKFPFENLPSYFCELVIPYMKNIHFLQLIPLYENELYYILENDGDTLIQKFIEQKIPLYIDLNRRNSLTKSDYSTEKYGKTATFCTNCGYILKNIKPNIKKIKCPDCGKKIKLKS